MKLPRDLSGRALAKALERNLRIGTLNAIVKAIAAHKSLDKDGVISLLKAL